MNYPTDWRDLFMQVVHLPERLSMGFHNDFRWLLRHWLMRYWKEQGWPVLRDDLAASGLGRKAVTAAHFPDLLNTWGQLENLLREFRGEHYPSWWLSELRFRNGPYLRHGGVEEALVNAASYWRESGFQLDVGVLMAQPPKGQLVPLPYGLNANGIAEIAYRKTHSIQVCLGLRCERTATPSWVADTPLKAPELPKPAQRYVSVYDSKFMQYYGHVHPTMPEDELRDLLGFEPKGKTGVSERILHRSVLTVFAEEPVKRHYRGKEMERLEIDTWLPRLCIGFEYQGEQHFKANKHWHGESGFQAQLERDARKKALAKKLGYQLFFFGPKDEIGPKAILALMRKHWIVTPSFAIQKGLVCI